ncbi:MAG: proprotein convertase P-domain-containing protein [Verrucomicrobiota bacterium]
MKNLRFPLFCIPFFLATPLVAAGPKTQSPVKIDPAAIDQSPYRFNGVVRTETSRGSGFCAWNSRTFFSAAHMVYEDTGWGAPPYWLPTVNADDVSIDDAILSRGYYRLNRYAEIVDEQGASAAFGKDVILAFAFQDLIPGKPAKVDFKGSTNLRQKGKKLITGYPAINSYTDTPTDGYHLYETGPINNPFNYASNGSLETTRVTTGPGNSGGPIWTQNSNKNWQASGILVGGLPSETEVYAFSEDLKALTRSVAPVVRKKQQSPFPVQGVSASTLFFPYNRSQALPDGSDKWSSFVVGVRGFGEGATLTSLKLNLTILTKHRGDLQVYLIAPGGYGVVLQNEQGAGENNLVFKNYDLTGAFAGIDPTGKWAVRVRDRLKGDVSTLKSFRLEVAADPAGEGDETGGGDFSN